MEIASIGSVLESAKDITLEAASSAAQFIEGMGTDGDISRLLGSSSPRDQANGLRLVLADAARGNAPTQYFSGVVKLASSASANVRRMVYQFVAMYGAHDPNLALMTINAIQKALVDKNPVVRSLALRTISSMPLPSVAPIVAMNVRSMSTDKSVLVRQTAANALGKCYELDSSLASDLVGVLQTLLDDTSPQVQGSALAVLAQYFPQRLDLLHKPFRSVCVNLARFEHTAVAPALRLLTGYARHFMGPDYADTKLVLTSTLGVLSSTQSDVVVAACATFDYLGQDLPPEAVAALANLDQTQLVCENVLQLAKRYPAAFNPHMRQFLLLPSDTDQQMATKLRILAQVAEPKDFSWMLQHLKFYASAYQSPLALTATFQTIASCAAKAESAPKTIRWLVKLVSTGDPSPELVSHALLSLRILMQQVDASTTTSTLQHIASLLSNEDLPVEARATILWLVGESAGIEKALAAETLRQFATTNDDDAVRLQVYQLAAKLLSYYQSSSDGFDERVPEMCKFVIRRGLSDPNYDSRDRCRMFTALLLNENEQQDLAALLLQVKKPSPLIDQAATDDYLLGSASLAAGRALLYYISLEDWGSRDPKLRDFAEPKKKDQRSGSPEIKQLSKETAASIPSGKKQVLSLNEFLGEFESESDSEAESEGESESETASEDETSSSDNAAQN